jgi:aminoglycoside phosphotransferase (APT) family kinase protein
MLRRTVEPDVISRLADILGEYLARRFPGMGSVRIPWIERSAGGGSRSMWFFDAEWTGEAPISHRLCFRADESTCFRDSEASLYKEFRVYRALEGTAVPVPRNLLYEDDRSWVGERFVIRERLDGEGDLYRQPPELRLRVLERFVEVLAAQHMLNPAGLGLDDVLYRPADGQDAVNHLLETWDAVARREALEPAPLFTAAMTWLRRHRPAKVDRISLCQGQTGPGQFLFDPADGRIVASLDWESAALGDPLGDVAYFAFMVQPLLAGGVDSLLRRYSELSGIALREENLRFYTVFHSYWAAVSCSVAANRFATGEMRKLQTAWLGLHAPRSFTRRLAKAIADMEVAS